MSADFVHVFEPDWWVHPETGVTVFAEDMPTELTPMKGMGA